MPQGIRIGRVIEVKPDPRNAGLVTLRIAPVADLDALREVYIVVPESDSETGAKN
jgi:cell shape-determining protein MreC